MMKIKIGFVAVLFLWTNLANGFFQDNQGVSGETKIRVPFSGHPLGSIYKSVAELREGDEVFAYDQNDSQGICRIDRIKTIVERKISHYVELIIEPVLLGKGKLPFLLHASEYFAPTLIFMGAAQLVANWSLREWTPVQACIPGDVLIGIGKLFMVKSCKQITNAQIKTYFITVYNSTAYSVSCQDLFCKSSTEINNVTSGILNAITEAPAETSYAIAVKEGFVGSSLVRVPCEAECLAGSSVKRIDDLKKGDLVYCYDKHGQVVTSKIVMTKHRTLKYTIDIEVADFAQKENKTLLPEDAYASYSQNERIRTGEDQKFFCLNKGEWIKAKHLTVGSTSEPTLLMARNKILKVVFISELKNTNTELFVINVEENHNFFVHKKDLLAHNFVVSVPILAWTFGGGVSFFIPIDLMLKGIGLIVLAKCMTDVGCSPTFTNLVVGHMDVQNRLALQSMLLNNSFANNLEIPYLFGLAKGDDDNNSQESKPSSKEDSSPPPDPKPPKKDDDDCKYKIASVDLEKKKLELDHKNNKCESKCNPETHLKEIARDAEIKKAEIKANHKHGLCQQKNPLEEPNKLKDNLFYYGKKGLEGVFLGAGAWAGKTFLDAASKKLYKKNFKTAREDFDEACSDKVVKFYNSIFEKNDNQQNSENK